MAVEDSGAARGPIRLHRDKGMLPRLITLGQRRTPLSDIYHYVLTRSWGGFFLLVASVFFLVNAIFALGYVSQPGGVANARPGSFEDAFYFSVQTLATIGYGGMYPLTRFTHALVTLEALTGMFATALVTGVTFAKFARPSSRVLFCERAVVTPRAGVPHLIFRLANWRHNQVVEAQLRVILLVRERTPEGDEHRVPIELKLVRDRTAMFFLTWTVMHCIDETSPFYGPGAVDRLREKDAELYLNLMGQDETFAQTIHARYRYELSDIVWNARFADVLTTQPDGTRTIDYRRFHQILPLPGTPPAPPAPAAAG